MSRCCCRPCRICRSSEPSASSSWTTSPTRGGRSHSRATSARSTSPRCALRCCTKAAERRPRRLRLATHREVDQLPVEHPRRGDGRVKVFIVSDMEGVAGIVKWQQTDGTQEKDAYKEGRVLYTEEINAAVRGAKAG